LLKTSPVNSQLSQMYNFQKTSSANWGQNILKISNTASGDVIDGGLCAFVKHADLTYAVEGGIVEWEFDAIELDELLGAGVPDVNT
jgi:hypothetical protein